MFENIPLLIAVMISRYTWWREAHPTKLRWRRRRLVIRSTYWGRWPWPTAPWSAATSDVICLGALLPGILVFRFPKLTYLFDTGVSIFARCTWRRREHTNWFTFSLLIQILLILFIPALGHSTRVVGSLGLGGFAFNGQGNRISDCVIGLGGRKRNRQVFVVFAWKIGDWYLKRNLETRRIFCLYFFEFKLNSWSW